jgi:hypothetical protein
MFTTGDSMDLDEMLATARPSTIPRDQTLLVDLEALALEARARRRRTRRSARWAIAGVAAVAIFGTGTAAVASGLLPFNWTSQQGGRCSITSATVVPAGETIWNEAAFKATTAAQRRTILDEGRRYLAGYDYKAIDIPAAVATWQRAVAAALASQPDPADPAARLQGDELESMAIVYRVRTDLAAHLKAMGFQPDVLDPVFSYTGRTGTDGVFRCEG